MAGGGSAHTPDGKKKARIEIIPLIDVVFFLLATFVLFTLSLNKIESIDINLPVATPPRPDQANEEPAVIQVTEGGSVYWNREFISMTELDPKILNYAKTTATPRILISGDDRAKFGPVVEVLDKVRLANVKQVSIETNYRATVR